MECLFPVVQDEENAGVRTLFNRPCGYCEACRLTYRQTWAARIQLEAQCHAENIFVTLTYDQDHLPDPPQLVPDHLSAFVKRLRARFAPLQFRFFACGEYGSRTLRPHYHVVLFGLPCNAEVGDRCLVRGALVTFRYLSLVQRVHLMSPSMCARIFPTMTSYLKVISVSSRG